MALQHEAYKNGVLGLANADIQWEKAVNVTAVLLDGSYTKNLDAHSTYGDISSAEITDVDYAPVPVNNRSVTLDGGNYPIQYNSDSVIYGDDVTISAYFMVFVVGDPLALAAGDRIISIHTFNEEAGVPQQVSSTNSDFKVNPSVGGWFGLNLA